MQTEIIAERHQPSTASTTSEQSSLRDLPFAGGFVLTRSQHSEIAHMVATDLPGGWRFWTDSLVATSYAEADSGDFLVIRGHWADLSEANGRDSDVARSLLIAAGDSSDQFHKRLNLLAGRYAIVLRIGEEVRVYNDTLGTRSVYYSLQSEIVCSHLRLLQQVEPQSGRIHKTAANAAVAMDDTFFRTARQLLPNFYLDAVSRSIVRFYPFEENQYTAWSHEDRMSRLVELWNRQLASYAKSHPRKVISLSGGLDSRLTLALSEEYVPSFSAYTYGCTAPPDRDMTSGEKRRFLELEQDVDTAQQVARLVRPKSHMLFDVTDSKVFREPHPMKESLRKLLQLNTWWSHSRGMIPRYKEALPGDDWLHLRSTGVEVIRRYWLAENSIEGVYDVILRRSKGRVTREMISDRAHALGYNSDLYGHHTIDLMYWEVRMGKWHAEVLNETDAAYDTLVPLGTREFFEILLAYGETQRRDGYAVRELINRQSPLLNFIGCNDTRNLYEQWRDGAKLY